MTARMDAQHEATGAGAVERAPKSAIRQPVSVTVAQLSGFDEIIDVRSEGEFAEDHIPGAVSCPVLNDAERARVGTIYKQVSSFEAKKLGAALVSANIARHLRERFQNRPRHWRPLVYCWRGGSRSDAFAHVLHQVGWRVARLDGGYRAYRRAVIADLALLPARFQWRPVCGLTGSGKSRLLRELEACGGQVLDLEEFAAHRGSVLGDLPDTPQPTQKMFESRIWSALRRFTPSRPVYVEAESRKIGALRVPETLIAAMWRGECVVLQAPAPLRVALLKEEYAHFISEPALLVAKLECLSGLYGRAAIDHWKLLAREKRWDELTGDLLLKHYDPAYTRSTLNHYPALSRATRLELTVGDGTDFRRVAQTCLETEQSGRGRR